MQKFRPFLFEFMDKSWIPGSLRDVIREIVEISLGRPPRRYYQWVVQETLKIVQREGIDRIVELGAGTAPISRRLLEATGPRSVIQFEVSDSQPDVGLYRRIEAQSGGQIRARLESVDLLERLPFRDKTLLVLSAVFHHVPPNERLIVLRHLAPHRVVIFEPLRPTGIAMVVAALSFFPGLWAPFHARNLQDFSRRVLWCWLLPLAPVMAAWDGVVSSLRTWDKDDWQQHFSHFLRRDQSMIMESTVLGLWVGWKV
jgi:hypothetical protein